MRRIRPLWKLALPAVLFLLALIPAPAAHASICTTSCNYDYGQCINVWHFSQRDCSLDLQHCLAHC